MPPAYAVLVEQANKWASEAGALLKQVPADAQAAVADQSRLEARRLYQLALGAYEQANRDLETSIQIDPQPQLQAALVQVRLLRAAVAKEMVGTYAADDPARLQLLRQAAGQFLAVGRDHRTRLVGLYARLYAGDCYMELGETASALEQYETIADVPDRPTPLAALKKLAVWRTMNCLLKQDPPQFERAIAIGSAWLRTTDELDKKDPDKLAAHLFLARAYLLRGGNGGNAEEKATAFRLAAANAQLVAQNSKEHANEAKQVLQHLPDAIVAAAAHQNGPYVEDPPEGGAVIVEDFGIEVRE